ncbi:hypothetical protein D3C75_282040 [compost metagenome]
MKRTKNRLKKKYYKRVAVGINGFWIRHNGHYWIVSDETFGCYIAAHERYMKAAQLARDKIKKHFDQYIEGLQVYRDRAHEEAMSRGGIRDENL